MSPNSKATLSWQKKAGFSLLVTVGFFLAAECLLAACDFQPTLADRDPYVGFETSIPLFVEQSGEYGSFLQTAPNKL
jgi:hypothetical protein